MAYVVAANQGASLKHYAPFSWPGGSMVVDYDGRILAQADPGPDEKIVVAEVGLGALHQARERRLGHNPLAHLRPQIYRVPVDVGLSAGSFTEASDPAGNHNPGQIETTIRALLARQRSRQSSGNE
jgi:formamidase